MCQEKKDCLREFLSHPEQTVRKIGIADAVGKKSGGNMQDIIEN